MNNTPTPSDPREEKPTHNRPDTRAEDLEIIRHWLREAHSVTHIDAQAIPEAMARRIVEAVHKGSDEALDAFARIIRGESNLAAEIAELKESNAILQSQVDNYDVNLQQVHLTQKGIWRGKVESAESRITQLESELATLRAELEAARKELFESQMANGELLIELQHCPTCAKNIKQRDTALAAKDAAERLINALESIPKTHAIGLAPSGTWQYFGENGNAAKPTKTARELLEVIAALTPAPTQEPPAGGVTADISTVEKERDHWKATAQLHYNARLELERERDRKGGDSSCAPS